MPEIAFEQPQSSSTLEGSLSGSVLNLPPLAEGLPRRLNKFVSRALILGLFVLPLMFGGVHARVWWTELALIFTFTLALFLRARPLITRIVSGHEFEPRYRFSGSVVMVLFAFLVYASLRIAIQAIAAADHPVNGIFSSMANRQGALLFVLQVFGFVSLFLLARCWLAGDPLRFGRLRRTILISSFMVTLIALSHWFYDSGELFWYFRPEHVFISERARWPFVNCDHLAHFLAPAFFLFLGVTTESFRGLFRPASTTARTQFKLSQIAFDSARQRHVISLAFLIIGLVSLMICLLATLSRGAWVAVAFTTVIFFFGERAISRRLDPVVPSSVAPSTRRPRSRRRRGGPPSHSLGNFDLLPFSALQLSTILKGAALIFAAGLFYLLLSQRGVELVQGRIEYGLMYSKQDIRWQLFSDTLAMIADNLFFGVGPAAWAQIYPRYMHPLLAGVTPVYLHSDPLQLLAETGIIGMLFWGFLFFEGIRRLFRAVTEREGLMAYQSLCTGCAVLALIFCSLFDFPFRIPAVQFYTAVYLALFCFSLESSKR